MKVGRAATRDDVSRATTELFDGKVGETVAGEDGDCRTYLDTGASGRHGGEAEYRISDRIGVGLRVSHTLGLTYPTGPYGRLDHVRAALQLTGRFRVAGAGRGK